MSENKTMIFHQDNKSCITAIATDQLFYSQLKLRIMIICQKDLMKYMTIKI